MIFKSGYLFKTPHRGGKLMDVKDKNTSLVLIIALFFALASSFTVSGVLSGIKFVSGTYTVKCKNIEVYWDTDCLQCVTIVEWMYLEPGDAVNKTIYLKNVDDRPLELSMTLRNWYPLETDGYMSFSWNREGDRVDAGEVLPTILTVHVSEKYPDVDSYSFLCVIEGTSLE